MAVSRMGRILASLLVVELSFAGCEPRAEPILPSTSQPLPVDPASLEKARALMDASAEVVRARQKLRMLQDQLRTAPEVPAGVAEVIDEQVQAEEWLEFAAPVWARHLDAAVLDELLAFYQTPAGRALVAARPALEKDIAEAEMQWGQRILMKVMQQSPQPPPSAGGR